MDENEALAAEEILEECAVEEPLTAEGLQKLPRQQAGAPVDAVGERKPSRRLPILALHVVAGFLGWYALTLLGCIALSILCTRLDVLSIVLVPFLPVPWFVAVLACLGVFLDKRRWISVGVLCALVVNTIGLIMRYDEVMFTESIEWILGGWLPFFLT